MNRRILFVDDEPHVLAAIRRTLDPAYVADSALSAAEALHKVATNEPYAVIVADMNMPVMNGRALLEQMVAVAPMTTRVMLTGNADQMTAVDAVNVGQVFRFLNKPCGDTLLNETLRAAAEHYDLLTSRQELLEKTLSGTLAVLADVLCMVDPIVFGESQKLRDRAKQLCSAMKYENAWQIEIACMLSKVGLISVSANVLAKMRLGQELAPQEKAALAKIPQIGHDLLAKVPYLKPVAEIVLYSDQRYNGSGFPENGVEGEAIPFGARVIKVLQDLHVLEQETSSTTLAFKTLTFRRGWYDPKILEDAARVLDSAPQNYAQSPVISLSARCLHAGIVLARDLITKDGRTLAAAGVVLTEPVVERLFEFLSMDLIPEPIYVYDVQAA